MTCDALKVKILDLIAEEKLAPGVKMPAFRTLARQFSTSVPTVQRAIAMLVSEGILQSKVGSGTFVAERRSNQSRLIGILLPYTGAIGDNFATTAQHHMREIFLQNGYIPIIVYPRSGTLGEERVTEEMFLIEQLMSQSIAGLIIGSASGVESSLWKKLCHLNIPIVCFNNIGRAARHFDYVTSDNEQGGRLAAERLIEAGRYPAVILGNQVESDAVSKRIRSFLDTFSEAGLAAPEIIDLEKRSAGRGVHIDQDLIKELRHFKGVFAINDNFAVETMTILRNAGIKVPDDIAVIGFDDSDVCDHVTPRLDSVRQYSAVMAEKAARLLLDRIAADDVPTDSIHVKVKVTLTKRESVQSAPDDTTPTPHDSHKTIIS